jgi:hypothetical protein
MGAAYLVAGLAVLASNLPGPTPKSAGGDECPGRAGAMPGRPLRQPGS